MYRAKLGDTIAEANLLNMFDSTKIIQKSQISIRAFRSWYKKYSFDKNLTNRFSVMINMDVNLNH